MQMEIDENSSTDGGSSSDEELDWRDQKLFSWYVYIGKSVVILSSKLWYLNIKIDVSRK